jgi:hypothetical protein
MTKIKDKMGKAIALTETIKNTYIENFVLEK